MKKPRTGWALLGFCLLVLVSCCALTGCSGGGDGDDGCPGLVCSDCSGRGDCDISCPQGETEFCGNFGYFSDQSLRCAFCAPPDFQPRELAMFQDQDGICQ